MFEERVVGLQRRIEELLDRGCGFTVIEEMIEAQECLSEEQRSALWLFAWALLPRRELRAQTTATLAMLAE